MQQKRNHVLENIPLELPPGEIRRQLHMKKDERWKDVETLIAMVRPFIQAEAVYHIGYIYEKGEDTVIIDGVRFKSRVLAKNLESAERVFPYIVTIGSSFKAYADAQNDLVSKYYLDVIGNVALSATRKYLEDVLRKDFALAGMSFMSPGSLEDWPVEEQKSLFSLFGEGESPIGVRLNKSLVMIPSKSVSGIYFPTEIPFVSCQLCSRENCPGRKAAFDEERAAAYGLKEK